jgi:hypothetical protein
VDVVDLDNLATFEVHAPGDVPMDDAEMKALLEPKTIEASAQQKFQLRVLGISLIFFPIWRFVIRDKESTSDRDLCIDGLKGQPITISIPPAPKRK